MQQEKTEGASAPAAALRAQLMKKKRTKKVKLTGLQIIRYALALSYQELRPTLEEFGRQARGLVRESQRQSLRQRSRRSLKA